MKKLMTLTIALIFAMSMCCLCAFSCSDAYTKVRELNFIEWYDTEGKIYCRGIDGYEYYGYIVLNGKQVAADYKFGSENGASSIWITVLADDLENYESNYDTARDSFDTIEDLDENNQLTTYEGYDIELFGEYFGSITLSYNQLTIDDFDAWEFGRYIRTEDKLFNLSYLSKAYSARKLVAAYIRKPMLEEYTYFAFQWLPEEKAFRMYSENDDYNWYDIEHGELVAEGSYTIESGTVTLMFTTDNLFNGEYPTLVLVNVYN